MKRLPAVMAMAGLLFSASAWGVDAPSQYSVEFQLITQSEDETYGGLGLDFFLTPVKNDSNPYAVQPFMQRASRVGVDVGIIQIPGFITLVDGLDDATVSVPAVITLPALDRRLQVTADLYDVTDEGGIAAWQLGLGYYVTDNFRIAADIVGDVWSADAEVGPKIVELEGYLPSERLALGLAFVAKEDFGDYFRFRTRYYPTKELGVNLDVYTGDGFPETIFDFGVDYVLGQIVVGASYLTEDEVFTANVKVRF